jgi:DNA (cytosine-5)-methyltransferase 1
MIEIEIATVCTGIGSPELAAQNLNIPHKIKFACEIDPFARKTYLANFTPNMMLHDMTKETWDGPEFYADLIIGGIPCQAFSLAGLRKGELDPRGLLFYDFYRYVKKQQPKAFIIENVRGLLSDNKGKTFQNWCALLGQSINGTLSMFNHPDSLLYNLHYKILNTKNYGLPQNRERVFLVGIRNDLSNNYSFPKPVKLKTRLKHILETNVNKKYYLSDKALSYLLKDSTNGWVDKLLINSPNKIGYEVANPGDSINIANLKSETRRRRVGKGIANAITTENKMTVYDPELVLISRECRSDEAKQQRRETGSNDFRKKEVVFEPSETVNCLQTRTTNDNLIAEPIEPVCAGLRGRADSSGKWKQELEPRNDHLSGTLTSVQEDNLIIETGPELKFIGGVGEPGRLKDGKTNSRNYSDGQRVYDADGIAATITNNKGGEGGASGLYLVGNIPTGTSESQSRIYSDEGLAPCVTAKTGGGHEPIILTQYKIRRLTPLECMRLQGFPDSFNLKNEYLKIINKRGINLYFCEQTKQFLCKNVQLSDVIEKSPQKGIASCTIKDYENTVMQLSFSNIRITDQILNVPLMVAIETFFPEVGVHDIITLTENMVMPFLWIREKMALERISNKQEGDFTKAAQANTDIIMKITLEGNCLEPNTYTTLTLINLITAWITSICVIPKKNTITYIISFSNLRENYTGAGLLALKTENTLFVSESQQYKQAGNSISETVIRGVIQNILPIIT